MTQIKSKPPYFIIFVFGKVFSTVIINYAIPHFWIHHSEIFHPRRNIFIIDCSNVDDFHFVLTAEFQHVSNILSWVFQFFAVDRDEWTTSAKLRPDGLWYMRLVTCRNGSWKPFLPKLGKFDLIVSLFE